MPEAKSVVSFALTFDQNPIDPDFRKVDYESLKINKVRTTTFANGLAFEIADLLQQAGYKTIPQPTNFVYIRDAENLLPAMHPPTFRIHYSFILRIAFPITKIPILISM
jgi:epoxyqueuosine reductase